MALTEWLIGLPAFLFLLIGIFALFLKGAIGGTAKSIAGIFGNYKLGAIVLVVLGLVFGGMAYGSDLFKSASSSVSGATIGSASSVTSPSIELGGCTLAGIGSGAGYTGATFRSDPNNLAREYIDLDDSNGTATINGTLTCKRKNTADLSKGGSVFCYTTSDSFRSETSTTDSNTYYILATTTTQSIVPGYVWQQNARLNDGSVATASSDIEGTNLVFAQDVAQRTLGFRFTVTDATTFNYLLNQSSKAVNVYCGGQTVNNKVSGGSQVYQFQFTKLGTNVQ